MEGEEVEEDTVMVVEGEGLVMVTGITGKENMPKSLQTKYLRSFLHTRKLSNNSSNINFNPPET